MIDARVMFRFTVKIVGESYLGWFVAAKSHTWAEEVCVYSYLVTIHFS